MHLTHGYSATSFLLNVWTIFSIKNTTFCPYELARQLGGTGSDFGYLISNPIPFLEWEKLAPGKNGTSWV